MASVFSVLSFVQGNSVQYGEFERLYSSYTSSSKLSQKLVDFELRLKYLIRRALYLGYRIRVAVD